MAIKIDDTKDLIPFRNTVLVRDNCVKINKVISFINELFRELVIQNEDWRARINNTFKHKKILLDGRSELNIKGSKDEKISGIIQNMEYPLEALKASSLFNLMF